MDLKHVCLCLTFLLLVFNKINVNQSIGVNAYINMNRHSIPYFDNFAYGGEYSFPFPLQDPELFNNPSESVEGRYRHAAVATDSFECSKIGTDIMRRQGGSAIDAAIAATLCSGVVNPQSCGIGGGHFLTYYNRANGYVYSVIGRERAPLASTEDMFTEDKNTSSQLGGKAIAVPGEIQGFYEAWKIGGRLPWKQLFLPTINLCRKGISVGKALRRAITNTERFLEQFQSFRDFLTNPDTGEIYQEGDTMFRPRLANTLEVIAEEGPNAFYGGSLTDSILAEIADAGGVITRDDLAQYTALIKPAVSFKLDNSHTMYSPPLPSGGVVYQYILNILKGFNFGPSSVLNADAAELTWHRIVEAFKHAFALRSRLGDNDMGSKEFIDEIDELVQKMTDSGYGEAIRSRISDTETFDPSYYDSDLFGVSGSGNMGTSHISVLGPNGDAVSITSTVNLFFGSKVIGSRTGILYNNEMDDFSTPGTVNFFGVPASPANFILPGKRPLSSMCPSIVIDRWGDVKLVIGAAGGTRIITSTAMVTIETLLFNWGLKEAIDYPRLHHQLFPPTLGVQQEFPQILKDGLQSFGHNLTVDTSLSIVQAVIVRNQVIANSDFRKGGEPDGF